jgi:hypothetical protein
MVSMATRPVPYRNILTRGSSSVSLECSGGSQKELLPSTTCSGWSQVDLPHKSGKRNPDSDS